MKKWFISKEAKKITTIILILCIVLVVQILGFLEFNKKLYDMSLEHSAQQVDELSTYIENNLYLELEHHIHILEVIESQLEKEDSLFSAGMAEQLKQVYSISDFQLMGVADLDGHGIDSSGNNYDISYDHIQEYIMDGEMYISNVLKDEDETLIFLAIPLRIKGEISGILWGKHALTELVADIDFTDDVYKYFQIVDDQGRYLLPSKNKFALAALSNHPNQTIWDELKQYEYPTGTSLQEVRTQVQHGKTGNFYCIGDDRGRHVNYRPLNINNWYLFSVQIDDGLHNYVHHTRHLAVKLFILLAIGLLAIFCAIYNLIYSMYKRLAQQNREVQAINAMFQSTLQQTKNIPFAIDHTLKQVVLYGYPSSDIVQHCSFTDMKPSNMLKKGLVDPSSLKEYQRLYQSLIIGKQKCDPAILYAHVGEKKDWIRVSITNDTLEGTEQMIGVLENYGEQKEKDLQIENHLDSLEKIEKKSQIDFLTKLYNRETFIKKVQFALSEASRRHQTCALLILDLDHFKEVNDCMGHGMGDVVLQQTATTLQNFFRKDDIVGRLGGDEFVVFAQNIKELPAFEQRIKKLNHLLCKSYRKDGKRIQVSASIGIMLTNESHLSFSSLYQKADQALYQVKESTRNGYRIYSQKKS